ncbi:patatin-like phospholipase family protein [Thiosocius teredinicola]|uniref:patatin-like phospholipase family protein n=1 Tax=Thiosocius teredinicola TaxID=1973002 RepID=UPI000990C16C
MNKEIFFNPIAVHCPRTDSLLLTVLVAALLAGCQPHDPMNDWVKDNYVERSGFPQLAAELKGVEESSLVSFDDDHLEVLAISGGGHRAAHYAIGALLAFDNISLGSVESGERSENTLLDEIDYISSVSGGSYGVAVYIAAYLEASCKGEQVKPALELLKRNRDRLDVMSSRWLLHIASRFGGLPAFDDDVRNIDVLEEKYHWRLTEVDACKGSPILTNRHHLTVADITRPHRNGPPVHIVNATNAHTGRVVSFYDLRPTSNLTKSDTSYGDRLADIDCYLWRGKWRKTTFTGDIPYSLALASSAAFPPLVSDGIFQAKIDGVTREEKDCGKNGGFVRLTDGGQADDNGVDAALDIVSHWLGSTTVDGLGKRSARRAMLISMDALVEVSTSTVESPVDDSLVEVAIMRNADLPRYSKKRRLKEELRSIDQKQPNEWERPSASHALFGASIGFSRNPSHFHCLAFGSNKNEGCGTTAGGGSDVSTFKNAGGLLLDERLSTIAEGYYQAMRRIYFEEPKHAPTMPYRKNHDLYEEAHRVAFDLLCSGITEKHTHNECMKHLGSPDHKHLQVCFMASGGTIESRDSVACATRFSAGTQAASLIRFNNAQEAGLLSDVRDAKKSSVGKFVDAYAADLSRTLDKYSDRLQKSLHAAEARQSALYDSVDLAHVNIFEFLLDRNKVSEKDAKDYRQIVDDAKSDFSNERVTLGNLKILKDKIANFEMKEDIKDRIKFSRNGDCFVQFEGRFLAPDWSVLLIENATAEQCKETVSEFSNRLQCAQGKAGDDCRPDSQCWGCVVERNATQFESKEGNPESLLEKAVQQIEASVQEKDKEGKPIKVDHHAVEAQRQQMLAQVQKLGALCQANTSAIESINLLRDLFRVNKPFNASLEEIFGRVERHRSLQIGPRGELCNHQEYYDGILEVGSRKVDDNELSRVFKALGGFKRATRNLFLPKDRIVAVDADGTRRAAVDSRTDSGASVLEQARVILREATSYDANRRIGIKEALTGMLNSEGEETENVRSLVELPLFDAPDIAQLQSSFATDAETAFCKVAAGNNDCDILAGLQVADLVDEKFDEKTKNALHAGISAYAAAISELNNSLSTLPRNIFVEQSRGVKRFSYRFDSTPIAQCLKRLDGKLKGFNPNKREWTTLSDYFHFSIPDVAACEVADLRI